MNCRAIEPLLLAERDGALASAQRTALDRHVAACSSCQLTRVRLNEALDAFRADTARVSLPDVDEEWRKVRAQLPGRRSQPAKKRPLAPVIWFGTSLAAAAALTLAYLGLPSNSPELSAAGEIAQAEFVEAGDAAASTMVYVDKESGWLVVWATDAGTQASG